MNCLISYLTKKSRGGVARKDDEIASDVLRLGRGADCEIYLADPRVLLNHARVLARPGGFFIETEGQGDLRVNGANTTAAKLKLGDRIDLGPYEIIVVEAPEGQDLALTVEMVRPLGDDLEQLKARSGTQLNKVGLGKRAWSWAGFATVIVLFLVVPILAFLLRPDFQKDAAMSGKQPGWASIADQSWLSGDISSQHKFFGVNCNACHQKAFVRVQDQACVACHDKVHAHADVKKFAFASFDNQLCESCHREHTGDQQIIVQAQRFCADCHVDLKQRGPSTALLNASDFGRDHPEFRPSIIQPDGKIERIALDASPRPKEGSNLKFPHDKHLKAKGVRNPDKGIVHLDCASCHKPDSGGAGMLPIRFETQCQTCHKLRFEPAALDRELPHGKPVEAQKVLLDFYAGLALRGGVKDADAPDVVRRRPGQPLVREEEKKEALAWATAKAQVVGDRVFGKTLCGSCHTVTKNGDMWAVAQVRLEQVWMPKARFNHGKHASVPCATCHAAAKSDNASDVLMPDIATCRNCHGGERAADKVPSTCVTCHVFHQPGLGPMRGPGTAAMRTPDHTALLEKAREAGTSATAAVGK